MHEEKLNCERGNEGLCGKIKGTKAYDEKKKRLRKKIKCADSAKGKKCISEKIDSEGESQGLLEEIKGTKAKAEKKVKGRKLGAERAKGESKK